MNRVGSYLKAGSFGYPRAAAYTASLLFAGMLIASTMGIAPYARAATPTIGTPAGTPPSFVELAEALGPSVVNIRVTKIQKTEARNTPNFQEGPFGDMLKRFFGEDAP